MTKQRPDKETLQKLYWQDELSTRQIGRLYSVNMSTIRRWMIKFNIPRRTYKDNPTPVPRGGQLSKAHRQAISEAQKELIKSGKRRYDGKHSPAWKGGPVTVKCAWCGNSVQVPRSYLKQVNRTFCKDKDCHGQWVSSRYKGRKYNHPHYGSEMIECAYCGAEFRRDRSAVKIRKRHFCNPECHRLFGNLELECENCGEAFFRPKFRDKGQEHVFCSRKCKDEWLRGDKAYRWKGGYEPYYGPNWRPQRQKARERDKHTCQHCGIHQSKLDRALDVHHIIPFSEFGIEKYHSANHLKNLISLCPSCHGKAEHNSGCSSQASS